MIDGLRLDGHSHTRGLLATASEYRWRESPDLDDAAWTASLRSDLAQVLGLRPAPTSTEFRVLEEKRLDGYRRLSIGFESVIGLDGFAFLLIPDGVSADNPVPGVLCLPGHGRGVDPIVGIDAEGRQRPIGQPAEYANDFALTCVAEGYVVLALEHLSFGRRKSPVAGRAESSCVVDAMALLMLGETMIGRRVHDARHALNILSQLPEVDPQRLATMGISGGGTVSLFTASLDERVSACVVSGYYCTFLESILAMDHCVDNFAPGLSRLVEMPDLAALIAPRKLFVESGTDDPIFPLPGFQKAVRHAERIFGDLGVSAHFGHEVFQGEHWFHGQGAFRYLRSNL